MTRQSYSDNLQNAPQQFELPQASLKYWPQWLDSSQASQLFTQLNDELQWSQDTIMMFGKPVQIPRQQVWMGEPHCQYRYSGTLFIPQHWHAAVNTLAARLSQFLQQPFNCVLLNRYQHGEQYMGWHADNEKELDDTAMIASISLGAVRRFDLKHRNLPVQLNLDLAAGSLLCMGPGMQQYWLHRLPKQSRVLQCRLNLTFRYIKPAR